MEKKKVPLSADEIIAGLGLEKRKLRKDIEIIIRILSEEMITRKELAKRLRGEPAYDCQEATDEQLGNRVESLRRYFGILGRQDGCCFIINSKADPKFQDNAVKNFGRKSVRGRALRSIIYEILKKKPLVVGPLARAVENHPDYDGSKGAGKKLKIAVNRVINDSGNKKSFFERDKSRGKYNVWRVKENLSSPPWKAGGYKEKLRPKRDALHQLMRAKAVINGWSYRDLFEATRQSALGYDSPETARNVLGNLFRRNGEYFERCSLKSPRRWRAKWLGQKKIPATALDFKDLTVKVLTDLAYSLSREDLAKAIRRYGDLFGYQTNELPLAFLESNVIRAIAGTKYAAIVL